MGIPSTTFTGGTTDTGAWPCRLKDRTSGPGRVWNRIPDESAARLALALGAQTIASELAVQFTDTQLLRLEASVLPLAERMT